MLHCNMEPVMTSQRGLEDLLADLQHARRCGDLGRLAFVSYCDVRRWARDAGQQTLAEQATRLITDSPHQTRDDFLNQIDELISALQALRVCAPVPEAAHRDRPQSGWAGLCATA